MRNERRLTATAMAAARVLVLVTLVSVAHGQPPGAATLRTSRQAQDAASMAKPAYAGPSNVASSVNPAPLASGTAADLVVPTQSGSSNVAGVAKPTLPASNVSAQPVGAVHSESSDSTSVAKATPPTSDATANVTFDATFNVQEPMGACCVDAVCVGSISSSACDALGGTWYSSADCATFTCPGGCPESSIVVTILTDSWPSEITWELVQQGSGAVVCSGGPYSAASTTYTTECCVTDSGCYDFTIYDAYGDGIYAPGGYEIAFNGTVVASTLGSGWCCTSETVTDIGGCIFEGACCYTGDPFCVVNLQADCTATGGTWLGAWTSCGVLADCNGNGTSDGCEIGMGLAPDCNENGIPDSCDIASGFSHDCQPDGIPDSCQDDCNGNGIADTCDLADCPPELIPENLWCRDCQGDGIPDGCQLGGGRRFVYQLDDGVSENSVGVGGGELAWLTHFNVDGTNNSIATIEVSFGSPSYPGSTGLTVGATFRVFVWSDPNGDGSPADAVMLGQGAGLVEAGSIDTDVFQSVALAPAVSVAPSFFIGVSAVCSSGSPAGMDQTAPIDAAWAYFGSAPLDPAMVTDSTNMMAIGLGGNWMLRATAGQPYHDCNGNGIPDDCDIRDCDGSLWCQDIDENGYPDICDPDCDGDVIPDAYEISICPQGDPSCADCNGNDIPDGCDIADCNPEDNSCQDCNGNGVPDGCDIESGTSTDCDWNSIPDDCEPLDCNGDGIPDNCDEDCNWNGIPDSCDIANCYLLPPEEQWWCQDCQPDGIPDGCQLHGCKRTGYGLLYAPSEGDNPTFRAAVSALLWGDPVNYFDARTGTPTLAQLQSYRGVLTWANYAYADKVAFGNNLADFADGGGVVILGQWCLPTAGNYLSGRIMTEPGYNPATASSYGASQYAGDGVECIHEGVVTYEATYRDNISLMPGATSDGTWVDGIPAVAYWPLWRRVYYSPGNTGGTYTTGDWARLTANMIDCWIIPPNPDCNQNLIPDECDIADCDGSPWCQDCNENRILDGCDIAHCHGSPWCRDCNGNEIPDGCDIASGTSQDCLPDGIPDECEPDCNGNGVADECDIDIGTSPDCNLDSIPDECQVPPLCPECLDCNADGIPDECQLVDNDCDLDGIPDECQVPPLCPECPDCNADGIPDECQLVDHDCNENDIPDECDIAGGFSQDCQPDGIPDECQIPTGGNPGDVLVSQAPDRTTGCFADCQCEFCGIGQQVRAENFRIHADRTAIRTVKVWGGNYPFDSQPTNYWHLNFYQGAGGYPGSSVYSYVGTATMQQTGAMLIGVHEWLLTFELAPPHPRFDAGVYWLTVYANTLSDDWIWEAGNVDQAHGLSNHRYGLVCPPSFPYSETGNLAFELIEGDSGPPLNDCNDNGIPDECECPLQGDLDNSGAVDGLDIQAFVDCALVGGDKCLCGDFDCSGEVGPSDLSEFVAALLTPG